LDEINKIKCRKGYRDSSNRVIIYFLIYRNKSDLTERLVEKSEGEYLANSYNISFFEASAKTGANVNEIFNKLTG
jgi:hypothetical protein